MKDVIFTINANTRKVVKTKDFIGINGENLQGNIIVDFADEFIDGYAYLEVDFGTTKGFIGMTKVDSHYVLPIQNSLLAVVGKIHCQIRIDKAIDANTMSVFKSEIFDIPVLEAINAQGTVPEEYPTWVENADLKLVEVDTAIANVQSSTSKPNLLINSNFAINQRGLSSYYNLGSSFYTVDRWKSISSLNTVTVNNDGTITFISGYLTNTYLKQVVEENLAGKTLTASVKVKTISSGNAILRAYYSADGTSWTSINGINITATGISSFTFDVPSNALYVSIDIGAGSNGTITFEWVKLEIGSVATLYSPPNIAEELKKCQRYYYDFSYVKSNSSLQIGCGVCYSATLAYLTLPIATMRTTPTIIKEISKLQTITTTTGTPSAFDFISISPNSLGVRTTGSYTAGQGVLLRFNGAPSAGYLALDAEIY